MVTIRQELAAQKLAENGGKSVSKAMREAGYSDITAATPKKLTNSKGWQKLMDKYLPEKDVAKVHQELLGASDVERARFELSDDDTLIKQTVEKIPGATFIRIAKTPLAKYAYYALPLHEHRKAGVEMAYRLRGKFAPDKIAVGSLAEFEEMSDEELKDAASISNEDDNPEESAGDTSVQEEV